MTFKASKVNTLPSTLEANTVYFLRDGAGFDLKVTTSSGTPVDLNSPEVLQGTGTDQDKAMSQDATTKALGNIPSEPKTSAYTLQATDRGKSVDTSANVTVPLNVFAVGDVVSITSTKEAALTVSPASGVTIRIAGTLDTGAFNIEDYGVVTMRMVSANNWRVIGVGIA